MCAKKVTKKETHFVFLNSGSFEHKRDLDCIVCYDGVIDTLYVYRKKRPVTMGEILEIFSYYQDYISQCTKIVFNFI